MLWSVLVTEDMNLSAVPEALEGVLTLTEYRVRS
jgi:hypothetical protein